MNPTDRQPDERHDTADADRSGTHIDERERALGRSAGTPDQDDPGPAIELGPGAEPPVSLDPDRDDAERNAAAGGWDGANEQIENDFEVEQLRRARSSDEDAGKTPLV